MPLNSLPTTRGESLVLNPALVGIVAEVSPADFGLNYTSMLPTKSFTSNGDGRGFFRKRLHADSLRMLDEVKLLRRPGAPAEKVDRDLSLQTFGVSSRHLDAVVVAREAQLLQKMQGAMGDPNVTEVKWVRQLMLLAKERRAAAFAADDGNVGDHSTPLVAWNDPTADVVTDITNGKTAVRANSGYMPNVLSLPWEVAVQLTRNKSIQALRGVQERKDMTSKGISALLQDVFGLDRVDVFTAIYNSKRPDVNSSYKPTAVWGHDVYLRYEPAGGPDFDKICWAVEAQDMFYNGGFEAGVYTFEVPDNETTVHRIKEDSDFVLLNKEVVFAWRTVFP